MTRGKRAGVVSMADQVSLRMGQVYAAIKRRMQPDDAIAEFGFSSRNAFHNQVRRLVDRGFIRRAAGAKARAHWDGPVYPYEVTERPLRAEPAPAGAKVLETYPSVGSKGERGIRIVRWKNWVIQGVPIARLDGSTGRSNHPPNNRIPNLWVVVLADVDALSDPPSPEEGITFLASVWEYLLESDVRFEVPRKLEKDSKGLTDHIALALDVDAVFDVSMPTP